MNRGTKLVIFGENSIKTAVFTDNGNVMDKTSIMNKDVTIHQKQVLS